MITDPIHKEDLDDVFDVVLPYLQRLHEKAGGEHPEEILRALKMGRYTLHVICDQGFCVLNWDVGVCHAVSAAAWTGSADNLFDIISDTVSYAKQHNCSKLTFISPRPAWKRLAPRFGAIRNGEHYEVEYVKTR